MVKELQVCEVEFGQMSYGRVTLYLPL